MVNPVPGYKVTTAYRKAGSLWRACGWHTGVDFAAPTGTPIVAPIGGDIRHRNYGSDFGPFQFVISPDADEPFGAGEVFFAHTLDRLPDGTRVEAGQRISRVGALGNVTGPHLHMELHSVKQKWSCDVMRDPQPVIDWRPQAVEPTVPPAGKVYLSYLKVDGHDLNDDGVSDSIKRAQAMLNKIAKHYGRDELLVPVTGKYWTQTDSLVRWHQDKFIPPADAVMKSFIGPRQAQMLVEQSGLPYEIVDDTKPSPAPAPSPSWWLSKAAVQLRNEIDAMWPGRDKRTDGAIGDAAHTTGEHVPNAQGEVRAIDVDADLDAAADTSWKLADLLREIAKTDGRIYYIIHDGKITSGTYPETRWTWRDYDGDNPHTSHLHISFFEAKDGAKFDLADRWAAMYEQPKPEPQPPTPDPAVTRAEFDALAARVTALEKSTKAAGAALST